MFIDISLTKSQAFLKVNEGPKGLCCSLKHLNFLWIPCDLAGAIFTAAVHSIESSHHETCQGEKEPMRIQRIQLFIWKDPQTHTIAFCCLIFNIDKHNCVYLSSQYWKQAIICNITTLQLKGIQAQQFPVPSKGGEWHRGGCIAYAGDAYVIFFPWEYINVVAINLLLYIYKWLLEKRFKSQHFSCAKLHTLNIWYWQ